MENSTADNSGTSIATQASSPQSGCLLCGADLLYLTERLPLECALCGETRIGDARCRGGHFICDDCHAGDANAWIERQCLQTDSTDAPALAVRLMGHPRVKMHGPEHHFLVPAVLLTAWLNLRGEGADKERALAEAAGRAKKVVGGSCGFHGACGAAVGVGIFVSIVTGATPLSAAEWRLCNLATAAALTRIAEGGGPRCCKRNTFLALEAAAKFAAAHLQRALPVGAISCEFSSGSRECLGPACGYFRRRER